MSALLPICENPGVFLSISTTNIDWIWFTGSCKFSFGDAYFSSFIFLSSSSIFLRYSFSFFTILLSISFLMSLICFMQSDFSFSLSYLMSLSVLKYFSASNLHLSFHISTFSSCDTDTAKELDAGVF